MWVQLAVSWLFIQPIQLVASQSLNLGVVEFCFTHLLALKVWLYRKAFRIQLWNLSIMLKLITVKVTKRNYVVQQQLLFITRTSHNHSELLTLRCLQIIQLFLCFKFTMQWAGDETIMPANLSIILLNNFTYQLTFYLEKQLMVQLLIMAEINTLCT